MSADYDLTLRDELSGPARTAAAALRAFRDEVNAVKAAMVGMELKAKAGIGAAVSSAKAAVKPAETAADRLRAVMGKLEKDVTSLKKQGASERAKNDRAALAEQRRVAREGLKIDRAFDQQRKADSAQRAKEAVASLKAQTHKVYDAPTSPTAAQMRASQRRAKEQDAKLAAQTFKVPTASGYAAKAGPTARAYGPTGRVFAATERSREALAGMKTPGRPPSIRGPRPSAANDNGGSGVGSVTSMLKAGAVVAVIGQIYSALGSVAMKLGEVTFAAGKWLLTTQMQRDASLLSFKLMFGGVDQANKAYERAIGLSMKLGTSAEETIGVFQSLGAQGMKIDDIETMAKSLADLKLVAPNMDPKRAIAAVGQIMSKGKLGLEELQGQLGDSANLNVGYVKDALAEILKVKGKTESETRAKVDKLISAGKIDSTTGVKAVQMAISRMAGGGEAGAAAMSANRSLAGTLSQLVNLPKNLGLTMQLPGTEPIIEFGQAIIKVLDVTKAPAKALQESVGGLFKSMVDVMFTGAPGESEIQKLVYGVRDAIDAVRATVDVVGPPIAAFVGGLVDGFADMWRVSAPLVGEIAKMFGGENQTAAQFMAQAARELGKAFAYVVVGTAAALAAVTAFAGAAFALVAAPFAELSMLVGQTIAVIEQVIETVSGTGNTLFAEGTMMGTNLIDGFAGGILAGIATVAEAASSLGSSAVSSVQATLDMHSPSRVMAELGGFTAAGFAAGVNDNAGPVDRAMTSLVSPPAPVAGGAGGGAGGTSVSRGGISIVVNVQGGASAEETGKVVAEQIRKVLESMGDEMAVAS